MFKDEGDWLSWANGVLNDAEQEPRRAQPLANVIYNESAGARPTAAQGPGSAADLSNSRRAMAEVVLNMEAARRREPVAPDRLSRREALAVERNPEARAQYGDARNAAEQALRAGGNRAGPKHFFHPWEGMPETKRPHWARGTAVRRFGPFLNTAPGDVPVRRRFWIEVHP